MSMLDLRPQVPCVLCHINMVPLGPMGDTGKKKCASCKNKATYHKRTKKYYKLRRAICKRCGKEYSGTSKKVCQMCQVIIIDLYNAMRNKECIYCGKPSGKRDFCSRICGSNTFNLMGKRNKKIDEVLKD